MIPTTSEGEGSNGGVLNARAGQITDGNFIGCAASGFLAGDHLAAEATVVERDGRKQIVAVDVRREDEIVVRGDFVCFTPDRHVLDR